MLVLARNNLHAAGLDHLSVRQGNMYQLRFADASFDTVTALEREGAEIIWIPVDAEGMIDVDAWQRALADSPETIACATALAANNEVGTVQPWRELAKTARDAGVPFHLDAIAALGQGTHIRTQSGRTRIPIDRAFSVKGFGTVVTGTLVSGAARWKLADVIPLGVMIRQPTGLFVKYDAKWKNFAELLADWQPLDRCHDCYGDAACSHLSHDACRAGARAARATR
jgi:hypothetical protein